MLFLLQWKLSLATGTHVCEHGVDTVFVDQAQGSAGDTQTHPAVFALHPETAVLQVGQETALGFDVGVRHMVSYHGLFARDFTYACHEDTPIVTTAAPARNMH